MEKLKQIYEKVTSETVPDNVTMDTDLRADMGLSSIGMLYFVIVIESAFDITFDNVGMEDFRTVGDVVRTIMERQNR